VEGASQFVVLLLFGVAACTWLCAVNGYARVHLTRTTRLLHYARNAALPVYILHQTILVLIAWWLVQVPMPVFPKFVEPQPR
jgi:hypothetical protein